MRVVVLLFASLRERAGCSELALELPAGARVSDALDALLETRPGLRPLGPEVRCARNQEFASREAPLQDGDELALIPPVSGG